MLKKIEQFCRRYDLLHHGDTLVIACSGGPDSLALLDILSRLRPVFDLTLIACYVHHGIRKAADGEVEFVRQAAAQRQCRFEWERVDVPALAALRHESVETTGRVERYRILRQVAMAYGAQAIAVAHHQNDQAETVLQHLLRGSGIHGLTGMRPHSGDIIRPFLAVTRQEIEDYIKRGQWQACDDETNHVPDYMRNRIRLELLPQLKQFNPSVVADLNRLADIVQADDDYLDFMARHQYNRLVQCEGGTYSIVKQSLMAQPLAMQRRILRRMIQCAGNGSGEIPFHYVEQLRQLAAKDTGRRFQTRVIQAWTTYTALCLCSRTETGQIELEPVQPMPAVTVDDDGTYYLEPYVLTKRLAAAQPDALPSAACLLDATQCTGPLELRFRRPGDWIRLGPRHLRKTLKKYFIDQKIPVQDRSSIPLLCRGAEVLWACGIICNSAAAASAHTTHYMICTITGGDFHA